MKQADLDRNEIIDKDEVLKMATEAGLCYESNGFIDWIDAGPSLHEMTLFAKLVADAATSKEREACAELEKNLAFSPAMFPTMAEYRAYRDGVLSYREAIRARGEPTLRGEA